MNPPMRKWISHWVTGCWITFYCLKIATLQQSVCPHLILSPNVPVGAQMGQENLLPAQCVCRAWNDNCAGREINGSCIVLFASFCARRGIKSMGTTVKCISLEMHWVICVWPYESHRVVDYSNRLNRASNLQTHKVKMFIHQGCEKISMISVTAI